MGSSCLGLFLYILLDLSTQVTLKLESFGIQIASFFRHILISMTVTDMLCLTKCLLSQAPKLLLFLVAFLGFCLVTAAALVFTSSTLANVSGFNP